MAAGALGSVSNRQRHENGDTHVVICDDVFSDAGSTPAASTISRRKSINCHDRKSFIESGLRFVTRIETFAGGGQVSRGLQYPSKVSRCRADSLSETRGIAFEFPVHRFDDHRRHRRLQRWMSGIRPNSAALQRRKV
jgi:hypothetical protein